MRFATFQERTQQGAARIGAGLVTLMSLKGKIQ